MIKRAIHLPRLVALSLFLMSIGVGQSAISEHSAVVKGAPIRIADQVPRFERAACEFPLPSGIPNDVTRECGYLFVPEVRGRANGRTLRLAVVVYRAKEPNGTLPLLLLHGGPGGIGGVRFPWTLMQFPVMRRRDVVAFDMRGAGISEPNICPEFEDQASAAFNRPTRKEWEEGYRAAVRACVTSAEVQRLDRNAYGADVNAADAIDLRRALGYPKWDIYGVSYGGLVAQQLMLLDPKGTRAAALISPATTGPYDAGQGALAFQKRLERVFASCKNQPSCQAAFPKLEDDFYALYEELSAKPVEIAVPGATAGRTVLLNGERFLMELRREFQQPPTVSRVPMLINEMRRGDRKAAFMRLVGGEGIPSWDAFGRIVQCNEYGASYREKVAETKPMLRPPLQAIADDFREHCDLWVPKLSHQLDTRPIVSDIPTLVLFGEYDSAMDPKTTQQRITARLQHAYAYILVGETHANTPVGCHRTILEQFLEDPMRAPDSSCLATMPEIQFKTRGLDPTLTLKIKGASKTQTPFSGTWEATLGGGPDWTFELEIDGKVLRGNVLERNVPISDGNVEGEILSFKLKSPDGARTITFTGRLQGNELSFTRDVEVVPGGNPGGRGLFGGTQLRGFTAKRLR
jgi:pimeloyl-ACP methyl ester carboxylesterase